MRYLVVLMAALAVSGCAPYITKHPAPSQNYRLKGDDQAVLITGVIEVDRKILDKNTLKAIISINASPYITVPLDLQGNGESAGTPYLNKTTAATCNGTAVTSNLTSITCMVFIDNEKTVSLTF